MSETSSAPSPTIHTYAGDLDKARKEREKNPRRETATTSPLPTKTELPTQKAEVSAKATQEQIKKLAKNKQPEVRDTKYGAQILTDKKKRRVSLIAQIQNSLKNIFNAKQTTQTNTSFRQNANRTKSKAYASPSDYEKVVAHVSKKYQDNEDNLKDSVPVIENPQTKTKVTNAEPPTWDSADTNQEKDEVSVSEKVNNKILEEGKREAGLNRKENNFIIPNIPREPTTVEPDSQTTTTVAATQSELENPTTLSKPITPIIPIPTNDEAIAPVNDNEPSYLETQPEQTTPENETPDFTDYKNNPPAPTTIPEPITLRTEPIAPQIPSADLPSGLPIDTNLNTTNSLRTESIENTSTGNQPAQKLSRRWLSVVPTINSLPVVVGIILIIGVAGYILQNTSLLNIGKSTITAPVADALFQSAKIQTVVPTILTKENIMRQITEATIPDATVTEVHLLNTHAGERMNGSTVVDLLKFSMPVNTRANINMVTFGNYREQPWLVFQISDLNATRGGFLSWEISMPQNLQPLFSINTPVNNQDRSRFTDDVIDNIDVRVLRTTDGNEEIVYGFIRPNVILLTTDSLRFLNLQANYSK